MFISFFQLIYDEDQPYLKANELQIARRFKGTKGKTRKLQIEKKTVNLLILKGVLQDWIISYYYLDHRIGLILSYNFMV